MKLPESLFPDIHLPDGLYHMRFFPDSDVAHYMSTCAIYKMHCTILKLFMHNLKISE